MRLTLTNKFENLPVYVVYSFLLLFMMLFLPGKVFSAETLLVRSEYYNSARDIWHNTIHWNFHVEANGKMSVFKQGDESPLVVVHYDSSGKSFTLQKNLQQGRRTVNLTEDVAGIVLLSAGFPVPYDFLAAGNKAESLITTVRTTNGGVTFSSEISRSFVSVTYEEAVLAGMIDDSLLAEAPLQDLKLISVYRSGKLQVKQLWRQSDIFWLYEETSLRRSWCVLPWDICAICLMES